MRHQIIFYLLTLLFIIQTNIHSKEQCPDTDPVTWTNCLGKKTNEKGDKYEGGFLNGKYHGYGRYVFKNGEIYEGYFAYGKKHGKGKEIFTDGSVYEGELFENNRQGKGTFTIGDWKYVGDFKNHVREGKGTLYYPNGSTYEGEFRNNVKDGYGVLKTKDNSVTVSGQYKDDKIITGTSIHNDGHKYIGAFKNQLYDGLGKRIYPNGDIAEGIFKEGKLTPNGVVFYFKSTGDKFVGDYVKDFKHFKKGTYFHANGEKFVGEFDEKNKKFNGINYFANGSSVVIKNGQSIETNYNNTELNAKNYPRPPEQKDPILSWILGLGVLATLIVGIKTRSLLMGGGVLFATTSLVFAFGPAPIIVLIMGIPATIALFYFGNKEIESRKK